MELTTEAIQHLAIGKVFQPDNPGTTINSMHCSDDGRLLVTCDDKTIRVYDCEQGNRQYDIACKSHGVGITRFTHNNNMVIHASKNDWDATLRYLSLNEDKYHRYFSGHRARVVSISCSPQDDSFLSASVDGVVRVWDIRIQNCQGQITTPHRTSVAHDPTGMVFAVSSGPIVRMYDWRKFEQGAFGSFPAVFANQPRPEYISHMKFSPDNKKLAISCPLGVLLHDPYTFDKLHEITDFQHSSTHDFEPDFTPDSKFLASGSEDAVIHVWSADTGKKLCEKSGHNQPVGCVLFNSAYLLMVSSCETTAFWVPDIPVSKP